MTGSGPVVGVLGGGQLGRMLAIAGAPLGVEVRVLDHKPDACAATIAPLTVAPFGDLDAVRAFAGRCDVVTTEFESVPVEACEAAACEAPLRPGIASQRTAQDRALERALFAELGIQTPRWASADTLDQLVSLAREHPMPALVKRRLGGYDGKGQAVLRSPDDAQRVFAELEGDRGGVILDQVIQFDRELSVIAVRALDGATRCYPLSQNEHERGILKRSVAPAPRTSDALECRARDAVCAIVDRLDHVGVLALELFQQGEELLANEIAPRVHNTGHWTIEGAWTSQFENHLRAILGWPLGDTEARVSGPDSAWEMVNLIGEIPPIERMLGVSGLHVHVYGKGAKPGRKLGHVTRLLDARAPGIGDVPSWLRGLARG